MRFGSIEISSSCLVLWTWLLYQDTAGIVPLVMLACVLHELGHLAALYCFQQHIQRIKLTVFGAQIIFENTLSYMGEFMTALAGPGVNLLLSYFCCAFPGDYVFSGINLSLAIFNLLPVEHLDGRWCLDSFLYMVFSVSTADGISMMISDFFSSIFLILGIVLTVFGANCSLLLMWIWMVKGCFNENMAKEEKK